jgi:hypothetical protein
MYSSSAHRLHGVSKRASLANVADHDWIRGFLKGIMRAALGKQEAS